MDAEGFGVLLKLCFAKPIVCMRVALHENDGNHQNDEDNSDSYKQEELKAE